MDDCDELTGQQSCTESAKPLSLNSNWRWIDQAGSTENCYTDSEWDTTVCPAGETCAKNCAVGAVPEADWLMEHVCEAILRGYLMQSGKKKFNVLWCCFAIVNVLREAFLTISASCIHRQLCWFSLFSLAQTSSTQAAHRLSWGVTNKQCSTLSAIEIRGRYPYGFF